MGGQIFKSSDFNGFQFERKNMNSYDKYDTNNKENSKRDEDLIIEDNTVYEIDRECYERLRRQKKRK
jgi:hypothetical protein